MATNPKRIPRLMTVEHKHWITPNMIRVRFVADWMAELQSGIEGAHCKVFLPKEAQPSADFAEQLANGPRPDVRTYTIRFLDPEARWIDIDFVDHGDAGPASAFARRCKAGDICGFAGPGPVKLPEFYADSYLVAADMSALPVAAATLEAMPRDAKGLALLEITSDEDRQQINAPEGVELRWLIHPDSAAVPMHAAQTILDLPEFTGTVQTCIAGESSMIRALRQNLTVDRALPKKDMYISGYWKVGMIEDEHQVYKNSLPN